MRYVLFAVLLCAELSSSQLRQSGKDAKILTFENVQGIGGEYRFEFETSDGTRREETGKVERGPDGEESAVVEGSYSYVGDNDAIYTVNYVADKDGYRLKQQAPQIPAIRAKQRQDEIQPRLSPALLGSLVSGGIR